MSDIFEYAFLGLFAFAHFLIYSIAIGFVGLVGYEIYQDWSELGPLVLGFLALCIIVIGLGYAYVESDLVSKVVHKTTILDEQLRE